MPGSGCLLKCSISFHRLCQSERTITIGYRAFGIGIQYVGVPI